MVNFDQPIRLMVHGTKVKPGDTSLEPGIQVLLEDARTGTGRLRVFRAPVGLPLGVQGESQRWAGAVAFFMER
jgi:hypothetical protein